MFLTLFDMQSLSAREGSSEADVLLAQLSRAVARAAWGEAGTIARMIRREARRELFLARNWQTEDVGRGALRALGDRLVVAAMATPDLVRRTSRIVSDEREPFRPSDWEELATAVAVTAMRSKLLALEIGPRDLLEGDFRKLAATLCDRDPTTPRAQVSLVLRELGVSEDTIDRLFQARKKAQQRAKGTRAAMSP